MVDRATVLETMEGARLIKRCEVTVSRLSSVAEVVSTGGVDPFLVAADEALVELESIASEFGSDPFWVQEQNRVFGEEVVSEFVLQVAQEVLNVREAVTV